jgi:hypothetical protein
MSNGSDREPNPRPQRWQALVLISNTDLTIAPIFWGLLPNKTYMHENNLLVYIKMNPGYWLKLSQIPATCKWTVDDEFIADLLTSDIEEKDRFDDLKGSRGHNGLERCLIFQFKCLFGGRNFFHLFTDEIQTDFICYLFLMCQRNARCYSLSERLRVRSSAEVHSTSN